MKNIASPSYLQNNMKNLINISVYVFGIILISCIEEYKPTNAIQAFESHLVIEGQILSGDETIVFISKTKPVNSIEQPETIRNADVILIGLNGYISQRAIFDTENNRYVIPTYNLSEDTQYAIEVKLDGETYQSEYQPILSTPEITEVNYLEQDNGISLRVSTKGTDEDARHYMWTYDEDWELHAEIDITQETNGEWMYDTTYYPLLSEEKNPYLYCWGHNESSQIHIYSTDELSTNEVKEHEFLFIPIDDVRISYLYSILLKQACLSEKGYEYYRLMKSYTQESSGLFAPAPGEVEGNVKCISNPRVKVSGYIMASHINTKRIFIYESDLQKITSQYTNCTPAYGYEQSTTVSGGWVRDWEKEIKIAAAVVYNEKPGIIDDSSIIYSRTCVNCLATNKATKKRPDFWPNNHE